MMTIFAFIGIAVSAFAVLFVVVLLYTKYQTTRRGRIARHIRDKYKLENIYGSFMIYDIDKNGDIIIDDCDMLAIREQLVKLLKLFLVDSKENDKQYIIKALFDD